MPSGGRPFILTSALFRKIFRKKLPESLQLSCFKAYFLLIHGLYQVAFSFIRKMITPGTPGIPVQPDTTEPPELPLPVNTDFDLTQLSIEVSDNDSLLTQAQEDAAMMHAGGQSAEAVELLFNEIQQSPHKTESWLMLFELLQQTHNKDRFDETGLLFVLEFEKTPPLWRQASPAVISEQQNYYLFPAILTGNHIDKEIALFKAASHGCQSMRIDLAKVKEIDTIAAAELLAQWQRCRQQNIRLQLSGNTEIETLLQSRIQTGRAIPAEAPLWLLLIELQQIQGRQEEFENLAVDYAITFEVSPPSWIEPKAAVATARPALNRKPADRLILEGDLLSSQPGPLATIRDYVRQHEFAVVDFGQVNRVDFDSSGQLLSLCMEKKITLCNVNALILALFRIMGITELAILSLSSQK